ncbi:uncharacterized protein LOC113353003 [Papaver somniferum]|uniref:uncharacterized protein LOC113353003 n=1 Tax=Papaver somniferum TaxID=3469 RepID=UPI000E704F26|nr:uncharacterized protein LOC113353003 [Papaver somniferum]
MSKDQCQTHLDQQESTTISENKDHPEQQESTTVIEKKDYSLEGDLGMPVIKATPRRFTSPSRTMFLTMEDLEFVRPYYSFLLKIEEIPGAKAQQRRVADKESEHPIEVVDYPPLISKKDWIEKSKVWNLHGDLFWSRLESEKGSLFIHICGIPDKGYGAILRDSQYVPVVARSKCLSGVETTMSTFYSRLNGVALGVQIARDYKLSNFFMYLPSFDLCNYMRGIWDRNGEGEKSGCLAKYRVTSLLRPEDMCDFEKIYSLTRNIISDLDAIHYRGITYFKVDPVLSIFNKAAAFLANLSSEKEMKAADILENEQLSEILYEDAVL